MIRTLLIISLLITPFLNHAQQQSIVHQIQFGRNKHELSNQDKKLLSILSDTLLTKKDFIIYINGHADSDADSSYNQQLSLKRSVAVRNFLLEKGLSEFVILVQGLGEEQPLVANNTPLEKAKNRRVELLVLFEEKAVEESITPQTQIETPGCNGDTTVVLEGGYKLTLTKCDWEKNQSCLRIEKKFNYKFKVKENWLKKRIGFKNYKKVISYEPHYEFYVVGCVDSCFQKPVKLSISHYQAPGLKTGIRYSQKKNEKGNIAGLTFKNIKTGDSAYYVADVYCPGTLNCVTDNRCSHPVSLYAKNKITILSYSFYERKLFPQRDTIVTAKPITKKLLTDNYRHAFFETLTILHNGDTITLKNIPIDVFAHGRKKIKTKVSESDKSYFLFIPYRKKYACGHYKKYKIRAKDLVNLKQFHLPDLSIQ